MARFKSGKWVLTPFILFLIISIIGVLIVLINNSFKLNKINTNWLLVGSSIIITSIIAIILAMRFSVAGYNYISLEDTKKETILGNIRPILNKYDFQKKDDCTIYNSTYCAYSRKLDLNLVIVEREKSPFERGSGRKRFVYIGPVFKKNKQNLNRLEKEMEQKFSKC